MARRWSHLRPDGRRSHRVHHLRVHRRAPPHAGGMAGAPRSRADAPTRRSPRRGVPGCVGGEGVREPRTRGSCGSLATSSPRASPRKPDSDAYTLALVSHPGSFDLSSEADAWGRTGVIELLRRNPDLLVDDVWRLFEVEGGGENSLAAYDKYSREENTWRAALVELGEDGSLDRERLLDASLDALQRGFAQFRAQWFSAFHEALRPTPAERERGRRPISRSRRARSDRRPRWRSKRSGRSRKPEISTLRRSSRRSVLRCWHPARAQPSKPWPCSPTPARPSLHYDSTPPRSSWRRSATALRTCRSRPRRSSGRGSRTRRMRWPPRCRAIAPGCHPSVRSDLATWLSDGAGASESRPTQSAFSSRPTRREPGELRPVRDLDDLLELTATSIEAPGTPDELEAVITAIAAAGHGAVAGHRARSRWLDAPRRCGARPVRRSSCSHGW